MEQVPDLKVAPVGNTRTVNGILSSAESGQDKVGPIRVESYTNQSEAEDGA